MSTIIRGKNPAKPWTVRYRAAGKQREKSFTTQREARDYKTALDYDIRSGRFTDPRAGRENFADACARWISHADLRPRTRENYGSALRLYVVPVLGDFTIAQAAADRVRVLELLSSMSGTSKSLRATVRSVIVSTLDESVRAGLIGDHRMREMPALEDSRRGEDTFDAKLFPTMAQVARIADGIGISAWLMRGCGLRICEALAVEKADFTLGGRHLSVRRQSTKTGDDAVPCKKRKPGDPPRVVPVPPYVWAMIRDLPDGVLSPPVYGDKKYRSYWSAWKRFGTAAKRAGVDPAVTMHWLRHQYASTLLAAGQPIGDVSEWLGHRDINTTFSIYRSCLPESAKRATDVLEAEYQAYAAG